MKTKSLFFPLLAISLVFSIIVIFVVSLFIPCPENLFPGFKTGYQLRNFLILSFEYFFPVYIASAVFSYSCTIRKDFEASERPNNFFFRFFKSTMILSLTVFAIFILMQELLLPELYTAQNRAVSKSLNQNSLTILAKQNITLKNYGKAGTYIDKALELDPKNPELLELKELCYVNNNENIDSFPANFELSEEIPTQESTPETLNPITKDENITVEKAIETAEYELQNKNWFNAHYYATLAVQLANDRNADKDKALRLASYAWNMIDKLSTTSDQEREYSLFKAKYTGYNLYQQGSYIESYYHFLDLSTKYPKDPDIIFFLALSKQKVQEFTFFIDEVSDYEFFESHTDKLLKIPCLDGGYCIVFFRGLSILNDRNLNNLFFRDFYLLKYKDENLEYSVYTPYSKMILEVDSNTQKTYPVLLLNSIDKKNKDISFKAVFSGNITSQLKSVLSDLFSVQDFYTALDSSYGVETLSLPQSMELLSRFNDFAQPREILLSNIIFRISYPLFFLVLCMFAPVFGFKLSKPLTRKFQFYWILFIPFIFFSISFLILNFDMFLTHLIFYVVCHSSFYFSLLIPSFLIILFIIFSLILGSQRISGNEEL